MKSASTRKQLSVTVSAIIVWAIISAISLDGNVIQFRQQVGAGAKHMVMRSTWMSKKLASMLPPDAACNDLSGHGILGRTEELTFGIQAGVRRIILETISPRAERS